jgi:hypothetical protein
VVDWNRTCFIFFSAAPCRLYVCLFVFISSTMRFSRYGLGAFATHNHATRNTRGAAKLIQRDCIVGPKLTPARGDPFSPKTLKLCMKPNLQPIPRGSRSCMRMLDSMRTADKNTLTTLAGRPPVCACACEPLKRHIRTLGESLK